MRAKQIKNIGIAGMISLGAALSLSACGSTTTVNSADIDVDSNDMTEAGTVLVNQGYQPLTGTSLVSAINNRTFSYRDGEKDANVNVTYFENGVASMTWSDDDGDRGMKKRLWTVEQSKYLCTWDHSEDDDCATVFTKAGQLATIDNDGEIHYMTQS
ncbi:hypothetical protein [Thalassospira marina]|uniref:Lipoprotein n=1 Tax=Thalassospira marina TaxID=2048283 RepID=A0A2N3KZ98_9PROT|nr:hypothetical protein [Thalassospira marina]AUG51887.1 hypothetical protein CSC3H3_03510 [Thalassospira marina]PKR55817.1 hypothetical protein COO20_00920 [Thalassospira marina]